MPHGPVFEPLKARAFLAVALGTDLLVRKPERIGEVQEVQTSGGDMRKSGAMASLTLYTCVELGITLTQYLHGAR